MNVWYIGYNQDMAREFINDCAFWARHYTQAAVEIGEEVLRDEDRDILTYVIRFASGFRVTALSSRPANLRGKQGVVVIDEAAFHDDLPGLLKAAMALLMWGGRVRVISTHNGDANPFNELVSDIRAGKKPYSLHRVTFEEAVDQGLYRRICLSLKQDYSAAQEADWVGSIRQSYGEDAAEELDVIPRSGGGAWLQRAVIEAAMQPRPVLRLWLADGFAQQSPPVREAEIRDWCEAKLLPLLSGLDPARRHFVGEDFGRSADLTVLWVLAQRQNLDLDTPFAVELRNVPFEQQRQILFYLLDRLPRFGAAAMDSRGNGQYLAEVAAQRYGGARIAQVMLSTQWYLEHMPRMKAAIEDRTAVLPRDADILADLRVLKMEKGVARVPERAGRWRGSDGGERHGDAAIALAMAVYAARVMEGFEMDWTPAPPGGMRETPEHRNRWVKDPLRDMPKEEVGLW